MLVDIPVFSGPEMADLRESLTNPPDYLNQDDPLNSLFRSMVVDRLATESTTSRSRFGRCSSTLSAPGRAVNAGYHAAATYEAEPARRSAAAARRS